MILLLIAVYLLGAIIFSVSMRRRGVDIFEGDDLSTYLFCGGIGLLWGVLLLPILLGYLVHIIADWKKGV